jgi:hypothetical protein
MHAKLRPFNMLVHHRRLSHILRQTNTTDSWFQTFAVFWRWNWQRVPKRRQITIWRRGNTQKNKYKIRQNLDNIKVTELETLETPRAEVRRKRPSNTALLIMTNYYSFRRKNEIAISMTKQVCNFSDTSGVCCTNWMIGTFHCSWLLPTFGRFDS